MVFANLTETAITLKKGETLCALSVINLCEYEIGSVQTDGEGHGREKCVEHLGSVISCEAQDRHSRTGAGNRPERLERGPVL